MEGLAGYMEDSDEHRGVRVVGSELVDNYTVYIIEVQTGVHGWRVKHRYSDFYDLHEKLTTENKIERNLLPPKKIIGKNSKSLVEKRQKDLEVYLQALLEKFPVTVPRALSHFLHFHLYEIHGIAAVLAEELYNNGEQLLLSGQVFHMSPLQLYAITQLLRHGKPTCINGDAKTDLGHILDFTCRLRYLKISGTKGCVGTSNIQEHLLPYDLSVFKSLCQVEIRHSDAKLIKGFTSCKKTLETMTVQSSASAMKDILVPEALEFDHWEAEGTTSDCPITAVIPKWSALTTVDMSHNQISCIDDSVKIAPQIEFLALSHNSISAIENLQYLYNLIHLDLSYNKLSGLEGVHSKIGNIKTLNLAGNLLESLKGLHKLYSLVNLDLSNNKIAQVEEVRNIGRLPCLETVILTDNPVTIIPDYRTKVLAQFGDRAAEICLDNTPTTEKELDTVEVLKAIQKAKEAKIKLSTADKKMSEDFRLAASSSAISPTASSSVSRSAASSPVPPPQSRPATILTGSDRTTSGIQPSGHDGGKSREPTKSETVSQNDDKSPRMLSPIALEEESTSVPEVHCSFFPAPCVSSVDTGQDFIPYFSTSIAHALKQRQHLAGKAEVMNTLGGESCEPGDGYFEMGLHEREHSMEWNLSERPPTHSQETNVMVVQVLWNFSIHLQGDDHVRPFPSCLVLTDTLIALFEVHREGPQQSHISLSSLLKLVGYFFYGDITEFIVVIPETCIALSVRSGEEYIVIVTDSQNLGGFSSCLHEQCSQNSIPLPSISSQVSGSGLQGFFEYLVQEHKFNLTDLEVKGVFPVCLFYNTEDSSRRNTGEDPQHENRCGTDKSSESLRFMKTNSEQSTEISVPIWLFVTQHDMIMVQIDFHTVPQDKKRFDFSQKTFKLSRVPLASIVVYPLCQLSEEDHSFQDGHVLRLMFDSTCVRAFFVLPQDKCRFLSLYKLLRTSLHNVRNIVVCKDLMNVKSTIDTFLETSKTHLQTVGNNKPPTTLSTAYPSENLLQKLGEENQIAFHLPASEALHFVASLSGRSIVEFFQKSVCEDEEEELRHLMWSPIMFYQTPDLEVTACVLLSTKAIYFVLDEKTKQINQTPLNPSGDGRLFHPCSCIVIRFSDLQSVNIGLFDQFFRITGPSPSHVVTCLTRDSYATHTFIQQLMSVLSLLARTPSPEPVEKDFYSEFGNKKTGKLENYELIHSSRVKFIYPNEEEIGDLTYIVTEQADAAGTLPSLNILLYVLAFHVVTAEEPDREALLQPKTLILTSSDLFLFDEDYISYPLPDFAKEPPKKDKYQLTDGRRIRDLDRVLMGYQTYPQTLTFVFDDSSNQDLMHSLSMDHFAEPLGPSDAQKSSSVSQEVQWYIFIPSADCREKLISLLARQWEILCGRELPLELTG
ncbi:nischarin isoform X2 [Hyperolius riggenbachi]|uniref:nischarin isoform X2 n=1 Tax=Hyperolius riggenbachi TaxID=752182 RepID=UPI0035A388BA